MNRPTLVDLVTPLPGQNHLGEMGALPKVHKRPADSRPVVDLSDTNQLRASVLVHLALLDLIDAAKKRWPNVLDVIDGENSTSIDLFEARLRAVASTGIDPLLSSGQAAAATAVAHIGAKEGSKLKVFHW